MNTTTISLLALLFAFPLVAQAAEDVNFLTDLVDFQNIRGMLPSYLKKRAGDLLLERREKVAHWSTSQEVNSRKAYLRERMIKALGGFPERTPLNARVVGVLEREDFKIEKIIFESQPKFFVTANIYLPKKGNPPYPGILFPLGHERGAKAHETWQQLLVSLARKGFVSLAWDTLGQGERVQIYDHELKEPKLAGSTTEHTMLGVQCLLVGDNVARYTIWDGIRALDYLVSRKEVDATRIACTGNSGGGTHTAYLSALDDRIQVAAPSCYLTSWGRLLETIGPQDAEQCIPPWISDGLDHADFVYAFAPKPYLILSAIRDFFSIQGARETYQEAQQVYKLLGSQDKLKMFEADDGHGYSKPRRLEAYQWFSRWLKGTEDREAETPVEAETEETLYCTDSGQVVTSLGGETVSSLNKQRLDRVRKKRPALTSLENIKVYREEIINEAARLSHFEISRGNPGNTSLWVRSYGEKSAGDYRMEKLTYESEPGILVPALLFVPKAGGERKAALLYVHGKGKSAEAASGGEIEQFVKAGFVVLAIDTRGTGETRAAQNPEQTNEMVRYFGDYDSAMTALLIGRPLVGMRALDICRGVDLLESRPEVDHERILAFGKEGGAPALLYAASSDHRIRQTAFEGMLVSYESVVNSRIHRGVFESVVPGALKSFDFPDLIASMAPRDVWIVNPVDAMGHRVSVQEIQIQYARALDAYALTGAKDSLHIRERKAEEGALKVYREMLAVVSREK